MDPATPSTRLAPDDRAMIINALRFMELQTTIRKETGLRRYYQHLQVVVQNV